MSAARQPDGRGAEWRKGGRVTSRAAGPELMDLLAEGIVVIVEACGGLLLTVALDTGGAEGLVEALGLSDRLKEETAARGVVHKSLPGCESFLP